MFKKISKFLFVPARPMVTTAPVHYVLRNQSMSNLWGWKPFASLAYAKKQLRIRHIKIDVNERCIEIPWIFSRLDFTQKGKVLDVGYLESTVSLSLATAGFKVTGIDIRIGELSHPNFTAIQADICDLDLRSGTFDYVLLLSTLEHIGLHTMYGAANVNTSDEAAVANCLRLLKKGGKLLVTTPIAKQTAENDFMRWYTKASLLKLVGAQRVTKLEYYTPSRDRSYWHAVVERGLPQPPKFGVALLEVTKA